LKKQREGYIYIERVRKEKEYRERKEIMCGGGRGGMTQKNLCLTPSLRQGRGSYEKYIIIIIS